MRGIHHKAYTWASLPEELSNIIGMDGKIKSSMCLQRGPGGLIPNRPENIWKAGGKFEIWRWGQSCSAAPGHSNLTE